MSFDRLQRLLVLAVAALGLLPPALLSKPAAEETLLSHARVVRLSYVSGTVTLKRPNSPEWENALLNTPLQEGFLLSTFAGGFAEVEFENGSTASLGESSQLLFTQLALSATGGKLNGMTLAQGYGTFHFWPEENDHNRVKAGDVTLTPNGKSRFRADLARDRVRLEVFAGSVEAATPTHLATLGEGKTLECLSGSAEQAFNIRAGIDKDAWDKWTEARDKQAHLAALDDSVGTMGLRYGWNELDTYGEWVRIPGRGLAWSPYAQAGWSPYSFGTWQWYPGFGWVWASGEPWGWLPYHCGQWFDDFSFGWYWMMPMDGCMFWEPSLVTWFRGPGWIGWAPSSGVSRPGGFRPPSGKGNPVQPPPFHPSPVSPDRSSGSGNSLVAGRNVTAVPTSVFQNRQMVTPDLVEHVPAGAGNRIEPPPFEPAGRSASTVVSPGPTPAAASGKGLAMHHSAAPPTILMGGDPGKESALLVGLHPRSRNEPLRARGGATLGGKYMVRGSTGEFRGERFKGGGVIGGGARAGGTGGGAAVVSHASSGGGASHAASGGGVTGGSSGSRGGSSGASGSAGAGHAGGGGGGGGGGGHH
jgi:hypothetical protein